MPYQVFGCRSGALEVMATCTRSASARSSGAILAIASRHSSSPSAALAPFLPSARSSAARSFIAARSCALNPVSLSVAVIALPLDVVGSARPLAEGYGPLDSARFSIPDRMPATNRRHAVGSDAGPSASRCDREALRVVGRCAGARTVGDGLTRRWLVEDT